MSEKNSSLQQQSDDFLQDLGDLQRLGQALYAREASRLARKHGLDDPRTQRMLRTASGAGAMLTALETARDAAPQEFTAAPEEIVIYGRAAHADLKSAAKVQVTLEDTAGRTLASAGSAITDARGQFALRISPAVATKLAGQEVVVTARDSQGAVVFRTTSPIKLAMSETHQVDLALGVRPPLRRATGAPPRPVPPTPEPGIPVEPERPQPPTDRALFSVRGQVLSATGKPAGGVLVRVYDKDIKFDDLLGAALTNRTGEFAVTYRHQDFSEKEVAADLYFVVVDANEKELLSTVREVKFNAERAVTVTLTLAA